MQCIHKNGEAPNREYFKQPGDGQGCHANWETGCVRNRLTKRPLSCNNRVDQLPGWTRSRRDDLPTQAGARSSHPHTAPQGSGWLVEWKPLINSDSHSKEELA